MEESRDPVEHDPVQDERRLQVDVDERAAVLAESFGLPADAAEAAAKDQILGANPAPASYDVELERIAEAQAREGDTSTN